MDNHHPNLPRLSQHVVSLGIGFVLLTVATAFRCPGPEPEGAAEGGGGEAGGPGQGGMTTTSNGMGGQGGSSLTTSTVTTSSITTGTGGMGGSGGGCDPLQTDFDPLNCGECGRPCSLDGVAIPICQGGVCVSECVSGRINFSVTLAPEPDDGCETLGSRVFVTANAVFADFGGALMGDAVCQVFANNAGLGGTWMAWLSDSATSPSARFVNSSSPYFLLDQTMIAANYADLTDGELLVGIDLDENATMLQGGEVWTATNASGTPDGQGNCTDWSDLTSAEPAMVGLSGGTSLEWSTVYLQFCNRDNVRLYCFEQ